MRSTFKVIVNYTVLLRAPAATATAMVGASNRGCHVRGATIVALSGSSRVAQSVRKRRRGHDETADDDHRHAARAQLFVPPLPDVRSGSRARRGLQGPLSTGIGATYVYPKCSRSSGRKRRQTERRATTRGLVLSRALDVSAETSDARRLPARRRTSGVIASAREATATSLGLGSDRL